MSRGNKIGLLHPGEMGSSVAAGLIASGQQLLWISSGRSSATKSRAENAGMQAVDSLSALLEQVDTVISICPPHAAVEVAQSVASGGFRGSYLDANAISPSTMETIAAILTPVGIDLIDGGIIGPPAHRQDTTRLYLSGPAADDLQTKFSAGLLPAITVSDRIGDASALKMAYAAYTKGHSALLLNARALARRFNVEEDLLSEWALSQPALAAKCDSEIPVAARKAWRFEGEMQEIAATMRTAGLPDGFHLGAAQLYHRCEHFRSDPQPDLQEILNSVLQTTETTPE